MNQHQPYGRVSARDRDRRRPAGWDLRFGVLMIFPLICLVVVLYEFLYLQQYTATGAGAQDAALQERNARLRRDDELVAASAAPKGMRSDVATKPASIVNGRHTMILIANYRDSKRCSETLKSIFDNAMSPDLVKISIFDQIYAKEGEKQCVEVFCELMGEAACRRKQIVSSQIDAKDAKGPTAARYETEKAIADEDFCMAIDSHLVFIKNWDEKVVAQWESVENPNAIITVYPKSTEHMASMETDTNVQLMCHSRIESEDMDSMIQYGAPIWLQKSKVPKPRLMSQLAGGFNFGNCKQAKEIRNDPYTPYLFHGEEYSRAARLWTHGYDFYVPSEDIVYHWYEPRKVVWERDWGERYVIQQASKRRIRYALGLPVTKEDFDRTDLDKFRLGTKRTMTQWIKFSGINPLAKYIGTDVEQFKNCGVLEYVPYE
ncbi:Hydroxyproline n-acetylglucosaminyltransferase, partial [Globisporangium splendens]